MRNKVLDGMLGLCVGDACGVPVEGSEKSERKKKPVMDMIGYGTYFQPPGTWSDDSSMALATLAGLCNGLDYDDIMGKFLDFYQKACFTAYDEVFDIGNVTRKALLGYDGTKPAYTCGLTRERDNSNGSLMRILPIVYYVRGRYTDGAYLTPEGFEIVHKLSKMTHAHPISQIACGLYISIALVFFDAQPVGNGQEAVRAAFRYYRKNPEFKGWIERFQCVESLSEIEALRESEVNSTGYVVDTLQAALWCFLTTDDYRDCVLKAVNLGGDTDTVAAVAGGLAGLRYGADAIPDSWKQNLAKRKEIVELCDKYYKICLKKEMESIEETIAYVKSRERKTVCEWKGAEPVSPDVFHFSYPVYEKQVYELMENIIPYSQFYCYDALEVIHKRGYASVKEALSEIHCADLDLCSAILSVFVRTERFEEGFWNEIFQNGNLFTVLCKLKDLVYDE